MANIKISELTALTPPDAADLVPVTDSSASQTKRTTVGEIVGIVNGDVDVANDGTATISELPVSKLQDGSARQLLQTDAAGTGVEWTSDVDVPGTLDVTSTGTFDAALNVAGLASLDGGIDVDGVFTVGNATGNIATTGTLGVSGQSTLASAAVSDLTSGRVVLAGTSGELEDSAALTFNGTQLDVDGDVIIAGDLTVEGASTILETETVKVEDKNIELGVVASPTDVTADGGGITLKGATDKTITWVDATDAWTSSERFSVPLGSDAAPSLTFTGDTNTGIYSPGADQLALSTNGTGRLFVDASGDVGVGTSIPQQKLSVSTGSNSDAGSISISLGAISDGSSRKALITKNTASPYEVTIATSDGGSNAPLIFKTSSTNEVARIDSLGQLGIGTSVPAVPLNISSSANGTPATSGTTQTHGSFRIGSSATTGCIDFGPNGPNPWIQATDRTNLSQNYNLLLNPNGGRVGIGTTPDARLTIQDGANIVARVKQLALDSYSNEGPGITFGRASDGAELSAVGVVNSEEFLIASRKGVLFGVGGGGLYSAVSEAARIDEFGRLLVGTSSARAVEPFGSATNGANSSHVFEGAGIACVYHSDTTAVNGSYLLLGRTRGSAVGSNTIVQAGDNLGTIGFAGADGTDLRTKAAAIYAEVDGTPGANDMPGRLVFSTTADGASSPTERMRIKSDGTINFSNVAVYADNTAALAGGLVAGDVYRKSDGTLMITY